MGPFGVPLGSLRVPLGSLLGPFGASRVPWGSCKGPSGSLWGAFGIPLGPFGVPLGSLGVPLGSLSGPLGASRVAWGSCKGSGGGRERSHRGKKGSARAFSGGSALWTPRAGQSVGKVARKSYHAPAHLVKPPGFRLEASPGGGVVGVATQCFCLSLCLLYVYSMSTSCLDVSMCLNVYYLLVHDRFSRPSKVHTSASATLPDVNSKASPHAADP